MQLICPRCHTNNYFDAEHTADHFVCVSCRSEFDAVIIDGALRTVLPQDSRALAASGPSAAAPDTAEDFFDILSIPQGPHAEVFAEASQPQLLEDVFDAEPEPSNVRSEAPAPQQLVEPAPDSDAAHAAQAAEPDAAQAAAVATPAAEAGAPARVPPPPAVDNYAVGMRVLRISPMWLLLSSVGFFALLLTLSWVSQPVGPVGEAVAAAGAAVPNQATRPAVKPAAAAPVAAVEEAKATAEKALPPAPKEAAKPAAEPAPQPAEQTGARQFSEAAGKGNFTVQVGSFNDPSEANQHVSRLRAAGFEARAVTVELPKRGTWYRVQAGRFETREEAAKANTQMRAKGVAAAAIVTEIKQ
ncbi:MAG TPA: SPOR domain-containing protein [Pyrinomonadaceae bacterium]|nr:SPOR domain-containing protein [Pyrinomonadaceae bacterium]